MLLKISKDIIIAELGKSFSVCNAIYTHYITRFSRLAIEKKLLEQGVSHVYIFIQYTARFAKYSIECMIERTCTRYA